MEIMVQYIDVLAFLQVFTDQSVLVATANNHL
jgi:hypothetical protein